jgi:predicted lipase
VIGERDYYLGHSLGGALALLFALKYGSRDTRVIASGCPRVGNAAFVEAIADSGRITRIINNSDPVTHLPPYWLGYRHPDSEVVRVSDQPRNFWSYVLGDFKAHWPARYIKALANL